MEEIVLKKLSEYRDNLKKAQTSEIKKMIKMSDSKIVKRLGLTANIDANAEYFNQDAAIAKLTRMEAAKELIQRGRIAEYIDDPQIIRLIDPGGLIKRIGKWPEFIEKAEKYMKKRDDLLNKILLLKNQVKRIVFPGVMGGSSIGHKLVIQMLKKMGFNQIAIEIIQDYQWKSNPLRETDLVVLYSFSGNTEEVIDWMPYIEKHPEDKVLVISKGGDLEKIANDNKYPYIKIPIAGTGMQQPREHLPMSIVISLFIFAQLNIATDPGCNSFSLGGIKFASLRKYLKELISHKYGPKVPLKENLAKQAALFLVYGASKPSDISDFSMDKHIILCAVDSYSASITRLKNQLGEVVEKYVSVCVFPEDFHNTIEALATGYLEDIGNRREPKNIFFRIRGNPDSDRAELRFDKTITNLMPNIKIFTFQIPDDLDPKDSMSVIKHEMELLLFLDYTRAYAAILRGVNPLPVDAMDFMKNFMKKIPLKKTKSSI